MLSIRIGPSQFHSIKLLISNLKKASLYRNCAFKNIVSLVIVTIARSDVLVKGLIYSHNYTSKNTNKYLQGSFTFTLYNSSVIYICDLTQQSRKIRLQLKYHGTNYAITMWSKCQVVSLHQSSNKQPLSYSTRYPKFAWLGKGFLYNIHDQSVRAWSKSHCIIQTSFNFVYF